MTFDLSAAFAAGGTHGALRRLVDEWFGVENLPPTATTVELLDVLRDDEILSQIPQPQDRLLPNSKIERINGAIVIAEENQILWCATLDPGADQPTVTFFEEPPEGRRPESELDRLASLDLDRFLLALLVENATHSAVTPRFSTPVGPRTETYNVLAPAVQLVVGTVQFPAVIAGPGWFGVQRHGRVDPARSSPEP